MWMMSTVLVSPSRFIEQHMRTVASLYFLILVFVSLLYQFVSLHASVDIGYLPILFYPA